MLENDFKITLELSQSLIKTIPIIGHIHAPSADEINLSGGVCVVRKASCLCRSLIALLVLSWVFIWEWGKGLY